MMDEAIDLAVALVGHGFNDMNCLQFMEQVNIRIGPVAFDHADYDAENDVLYLHIGEPLEAEGEETPEGHVLRFAPGTQSIVGLTVMGAQAILDCDGELRVTILESVGASADDLAPALAAV
jgi:uncharacterized protein YuzE